MCDFMTSLPKHSKSSGMNQRPKNLVLSLKPCADDKTYYRFRLLAFGGVGTTRDDPHICRWVHQIWGKHPEKGYPMVEDEIVCPVTPHAHIGTKAGPCKICDMANKYYVSYKESNYADKDAGKKYRQFKRQFQAIIPVYVVQDPNYDGNNGKFKVIIFNDKKFYQEFRAKIEKASLTNNVFNGKNAVDCCIHVKNEEKVGSNGQTYNLKVIDRVVFSTKPKDIPSITRETVDAMEFDKTYYVTSTEDEINAFYKKYCTISNDDIPDDDEIKVFDTKPAPVEVEIKAPTVVNQLSNDSVATTNSSDISNEEVDALLDDPDNIGLDVPEAPANDIPEAKPEVDPDDDVLKGLDDIL